MSKELLLGCGRSRDKRLVPYGQPKTWGELITLDMVEDHKPDVLFDLSDLGYVPLPFEDNTFDEIHAYEVLEHIGSQGDYQTFFAQFEELHRILKPGGYLCATCPSYLSMWAWGDPSHTRVITSGTLVFLSQAQYALQVGKSPMSDFRSIYKADFETTHCEENEEHLVFCLRAIKVSH